MAFAHAVIFPASQSYFLTVQFRLLIAPGLMFTVSSLPCHSSPPDEHEGYKTRVIILGWSVHVSDQLLETKPDKTELALKLCSKNNCKIVVDRVPASSGQESCRRFPSGSLLNIPIERPPRENIIPARQWLIDQWSPTGIGSLRRIFQCRDLSQRSQNGCRCSRCTSWRTPIITFTSPMTIRKF